jgi:hypothetical protein
MAAIFDITTPVDIAPIVPADRRWKVVIPYASPWAPIIAGPVPVTISVNEVVIPVVDDVIRRSIGYRKTIVVQVDEIGSDFQGKIRAVSGAHG